MAILQEKSMPMAHLSVAIGRKRYKGQAWIVYGHTPVAEPRFVNQTVNIDTGAVFGGKLTGLRYPEMETISVPSSYLLSLRNSVQFHNYLT